MMTSGKNGYFRKKIKFFDLLWVSSMTSKMTPPKIHQFIVNLESVAKYMGDICNTQVGSPTVRLRLASCTAWVK